MVTNMKNTIHGFKRLLGRKYNDQHVQQELKYLPFRVIQQPDGNIGVKVCPYTLHQLPPTVWLWVLWVWGARKNFKIYIRHFKRLMCFGCPAVCYTLALLNQLV
jgi:hypothetical protein